MKQIVIGTSGGLDSTTLLGFLLTQQKESIIHCVSFRYGSTHGKYEIEAVDKIIKYYQHIYPKRVRKYDVDITPVMDLFSSNLLIKNKKSIPEGSYNQENMEQTYVPGRNLIFASIMAGIAESIGAEEIALGVHSGGHYLYPDCRSEFVQALNAVVHASSDKKIKVLAPFVNMDKAEIIKLGLSLPAVPYHLTRSCYKNQPVSCGKCGTCKERLEAFATLGKKDFIQYQTQKSES